MIGKFRNTFAYKEQEKLLISDKDTRGYLDLNIKQKEETNNGLGLFLITIFGHSGFIGTNLKKYCLRNRIKIFLPQKKKIKFKKSWTCNLFYRNRRSKKSN